MEDHFLQYWKGQSLESYIVFNKLLRMIVGSLLQQILKQE